MVKIRDNESFEKAFRRFKKSCEKSGLLSEVKKTFSKFWSEEYDTIEDPTQRLKEIFTVIDNIGLMGLSEIEQMYAEMAEILDFNVEILNNLK